MSGSQPASEHWSEGRHCTAPAFGETFLLHIWIKHGIGQSINQVRVDSRDFIDNYQIYMS